MLFCPECGAQLQGPADEGKTSTIPFSEVFAGDGNPPLVGKGTTAVTNVTRLRFIIPTSGRKVILPLQGEIRIGRRDAQRGVNPELDLSEDNSAQAGVSRLHAKIITTAQGIAIMDLDSVNGTQVNDYRIPPNLPFALNSGDELKLGSLLVHVIFEG